MQQLGLQFVERELDELGLRPTRDASSGSSRLVVLGGPRRLELFVSCQRPGGYAFWTKRRLTPSPERFVTLVVARSPTNLEAFLIPTMDWLDPNPPLVAPDYHGLKSEPEYGIRMGVAALASLRRYRWDDRASRQLTG